MTNKNKLICTLVCSFLIVLSIFALFFTNNKTNANENTITIQYDTGIEDYLDSYGLGETIQIKPAKILYNGNEYSATPILYYPNGVTVSSGTVSLEQVGCYYVEYKANVNGEILSKKISFTVYDDLFSIKGSGTYSFGSAEQYMPGKEGLKLSLQQGDVFTFNKVLDLSSSVKGSTPVINFYAIPEEAGKKELDILTVKLTDIYDENNFVEVRYKAVSDYDAAIYVDAKANNQKYLGIHWQEKTLTSMAYDDGHCRLFQNHGAYGYYLYGSFTGIVPTHLYNYTNNYCYLNFDSQQNRIYTKSSGAVSNGLITDFDDPVLQGYDVWDGFTTGEVILSITASGSATSYNILIDSIYGVDLKQESAKNDLNVNVGVDFGIYEEDTLPNAIVGKNYPVYPIILPEISGINIVDSGVLVYHNYNSSSRTLVGVIDNQFNVEKEGIYTLYYYLEDSWGNVSIKTVDITAIKRDFVEVDFGTYQTQFNVGSTVKVSTPTFKNTIDGYTVKTTAKHKSQDVIYDILSYEFLPLYSGEYEICYEYTDNYGTTLFSYDITVEKTDTPIYYGDAEVPKYVIKGFDYKLPDYFAYDFSNGTSIIKGELYLSNDGKEEVLVKDNAFTVDAENYIDLIFKFDNGKEISKKIYSNIPVVNLYDENDKLCVWEMLQGSDFVVNPNTDYTSFTLSGKNNGKLDAVNKAHINMLELVYTANGNFNSVYIDLIKISDRTDSAKITFNRVGDSVNVVMKRNGKVIKELLTTNNFNSNVEISISVIDNNFVLSGTDEKVEVKELLSGFEDEMFMSIGIGGVSGEATLNVLKVNGLRLRTGTTRPSAPTLFYDEKTFTPHSLGEVIELSFGAFDFVDTSPYCTFALIDNKTGSYVLSDEGVLLDGVSNDFYTTYHLTVTEYFDYYIVFNLGNDWRPASPKTQALSVKDEVAPEIKIDVKLNTYSVNSKIDVAKATVVDDKDGEIDYFVFVVDANEYVTYLTEELSFTADKKGIYQVIYYAVDSSANATFESYYIQVK